MKRTGWIVALLCAIALHPAAAQQVRIGYLDGPRIETDTKRAFDAAELLRREFSSREQEVRTAEARVKALQSQLPGIKDARERELKEREFQTLSQRFEQQARAFVDDLERRKAEERRKYFQEVTQVVSQLATAQKFDLVVQDAVFASKALDITEQVIKALGGPAPKTAGKP
ncbi:MAG: OmpH family outer membrane protein [Burkholderiales bacterium]